MARIFSLFIRFRQTIFAPLRVFGRRFLRVIFTVSSRVRYYGWNRINATKNASQHTPLTEWGAYVSWLNPIREGCTNAGGVSRAMDSRRSPNYHEPQVEIVFYFNRRRWILRIPPCTRRVTRVTYLPLSTYLLTYFRFYCNNFYSGHTLFGDDDVTKRRDATATVQVRTRRYCTSIDRYLYVGWIVSPPP